MVVDLVQELLWIVSLISILVYSIQSFRKKKMSVVVSRDSPYTFSPSSSSGGCPFPWAGNNNDKCLLDGWQGEKISGNESKRQRAEELLSRDHKNNMLWNNVHCHDQEAIHKGLHDKNPFHATLENRDQLGSGGTNINIKMKKRPSRLILPESSSSCNPSMEFRGINKKVERKELEVEGRDYFLACKKGRRDIMEDDYGVMVNISGDPKQAFFAVIDGHGGRAAADYVAENLGKNIVRAIESVRKEEIDGLEQAIRGGYSATDEGFLSKGVIGGACTASVLLKEGQVHVANVGDCRVVLSRNNGVAEALTLDQRPGRADERLRIQNSGGYVHLRNGVWRVQGSLAISRAIGDAHLKEWIISEPEIRTIPITSDSEFLILASDGLWDKVSDQEAVDVVSREKNNTRSCCKKLVDMSSCRGNLDDITVMVINLQNFVANRHH